MECALLAFCAALIAFLVLRRRGNTGRGYHSAGPLNLTEK